MRKLNYAVLVSMTMLFCLVFTAFASAQATVSVATVNFGNVVLNTTSSPKSVTVMNTGTSSISISSLAVTAGTPYAITPSSTCLNPTLAAGKSCTVLLTLSPVTVGTQPAGTLTIASTAPNSPQSVALSGNGVAPTSLSGTALHFGNVPVGLTSSILSVNFYNNQPSVLTINSLTPSGAGFAVDPSTTCGATLAAYSICKIAMTFAPTASGAVSGALTINTNAANSPLTLTLSGTGLAPVTLTPATAYFGNQAVGSTSANRNFVLTNNQASSLSITQALFGGPFVLDTSAVTTCPISGGALSGTLAAGHSCIIGVDFKPTAVGAASGGQITVIDSAPNSPQVALLTGTGYASVVLSPSALAFGNVPVNGTSVTQSVKLTNQQAANLNFSSISVSAPYTLVSGSTTCAVGTPLAQGKSCVIGLSYSPTTLGAASPSALTIADDAPSSPQTVALTGSGVTAVTLNPASLNFGTVVLNSPAVQSLTLTNNQSVPLTINSITGLPARYTLKYPATTCRFAPANIPAGGSCVIALNLDAIVLGAQPGTISINDNSPSNPEIFSVSANAVAPLAASPSSLSFSSQPVGVPSTVQTITLTNQQSTPLAFSAPTISGANSGDFSITSNTCPFSPATLAVGGQCTLQVAFTPSSAGTRTASISISDPIIIPLTGTGNAPVTVLPGLLTFYSHVGTTSAYQTVTILNASSASIQFNKLQLSGPFEQTSTSCGVLPFTLASGASCAVTLSFNPVVGGVGDGQLQVYDTAVTSPQVVNLTGNGTYPLTYQPGSLSFSGQLVGTFSAAKTVVLTNHENKSETFTLAPSGDFKANSNCPTGIINANSTCNIYIEFNPSAIGTRNGSVTVNDTATGGVPLVISLTGSGTATNPAAAIAVISPGAGAAGTTVDVVITGNGWTHFNASSSIYVQDENGTNYPADIVATIPNPSLTTANTIHAQFVLTGGAGVVYGARYVKVNTPSGRRSDRGGAIGFGLPDYRSKQCAHHYDSCAGQRHSRPDAECGFDRHGNEPCAGCHLCELRRWRYRQLSDDQSQRP